MKTMMSNLQKDLTEEILTRVPLKHMRAVRLTCKNWNTLSRSESFRKKQIVHASSRKKEESRMILLINNNFYSVNVDLNDYPSTELKGELRCLNNQVKICRFLNFEGLLLCTLREDPRFMVWNPYFGQTRWIEPRHSHRPTGYALGYEDKEACRSLKFLRFIANTWYEIYDFDSDLWTTLDVTPHWCIGYSSGLYIKGNTYWLATEMNEEFEENDDDRGTDFRIICFDFTKERFGPLLPLPSTQINDCITLSCVGEEKLAVLLHHDRSNPSYEIEIWITTKLDVETVTWSRFLTRKWMPHPIEVDPYMSGGYFIDEEKKVAVGFNGDNPRTFRIIGEEGYSIKLDLGKPAVVEKPRPQGFPSWNSTRTMRRPQRFSYVPSYLQIKEPEQGQIRRQDSLEKHRFDQKMSRLATMKRPRIPMPEHLKEFMAKRRNIAE